MADEPKAPKGPPDQFSMLMTLILSDRNVLDGNAQGQYALFVAVVSLLIDNGLITKAQLVRRLQELHDQLQEEYRNGRPGLWLHTAIASFQPAAAEPPAKAVLRVIEGGLSQEAPSPKPSGEG